MEVTNINPSKYMSINEKYIDSMPEEEKDNLDEYCYLEEIRILKKAYDYYEKANKEEHGQLIDDYTKIIKKVSEYVRFKGNDNPIVMVGILSELIWNGFVSYDHSFVFSEVFDDNSELNGMYGINVIYGEGCCRNIAGLFNDILRECNVESELIGVKTHRFATSYFEIFSTRKDNNGEILNNFLMDEVNSVDGFEMNHADILFKYEGEYIVYDPTNIRFYILNGINGREIGGNGSITFQPSSLSLFDGYSYKEMVDKYSKLHSKNSYGLKDFMFNFYSGVNIFEKNYRLYNGMFHCMKPTLKRINEYKEKVLIKKDKD